MTLSIHMAEHDNGDEKAIVLVFSPGEYFGGGGDEELAGMRRLGRARGAGGTSRVWTHSVAVGALANGAAAVGFGRRGLAGLEGQVLLGSRPPRKWPAVLVLVGVGLQTGL
jgi:hypothetical protein